MFKGTRNKINNIIDSAKTAFLLFITTLQRLTDAIATNTTSNRVLTQEQKELRGQLAVLVDNTHFLVRARKNELLRQGHKVE